MPEVSVIIPNYNHAKYLPARIESVLGQSFDDFELIILDDCSTDNSREIIENFRHHPKVSAIIYNETNSGSTFKQWNKGIALAKGEWIWIAESDDRCELSMIDCMIQKTKAYPTVGIVYAQSREIDEISGESFISFTGHPRFSQTFLHDYFAKGRDEINDKLVYENTIPNASGVLFRKDIYRQCGGADETMKLCGDWMLWAKILTIADIYFIAEPLNYFRLTPASARSRFSHIQTFEERLKVLKYIKDQHIKKAKSAEMKLLTDMFNSYRITEINKPAHSILSQKQLIGNTNIKMMVAFIASLFGRIKKKFT